MNTEDTPIEEEEPQGLTSAGQFLAASCLSFCGVYVVFFLVFIMAGKDFGFDIGLGVIAGAISLLSLLFSVYGMIAKPSGREWLFALPTIGPILP